MSENCGFVYVATGAGYLAEAEASARSLRAHHPTAQICLFTDQPRAAGEPFDLILTHPQVCSTPIDKLVCIDAPYDRVIFLDTDTFICGELTELFRLLDRFDLALLQETLRGWHVKLEDVPLCFPEYNTGVIVFRRTPAMREFFTTWRRNYDELRRTHQQKGNQVSFRRTLYHSGLRVATLPSEFHFIANFPNYIMWRALLIHGRGELEAMAREVNREVGPRVWYPSVGALRGYRGRRAWLRDSCRFGWRMVRLLFRPPRDAALLNPSRWWL